LSNGDKFRIVTPTIGIMSVNGRRAIVTIPKNSVVKVVTTLLGNQRMVDVVWKNYSLLVFVQDLRERANLVDNSPDLKRVAALTRH
jgi:hypothetical protein